jgi:hypothetical protein
MDELLFYRIMRRGTEFHSEIICRAHYDAAVTQGSMAPLSDRETAAGMKQIVTPYTTGDRPCETCEQEARKGTAA